MKNSLNVYKVEYTRRQVRFLKNRFEVESETSRILTISGEEEELEKVMRACFLEKDEDFKKVFPDYPLEKETMDKEIKAFQELTSVVKDKLLEITNENFGSNEFIYLTRFLDNMESQCKAMKEIYSILK
jgi:hypothetical protein